MAHVCRACSRVNPPEARFCYYDGASLGGPGGGPVAVGALPFAAPFIFPSGRTCRSFDELALGCEAEWEAAREALGNGHLEAFLAGQGRADLAALARRAARGADRDRGLEQLLTRLPGDARHPPRLAVQPPEVNLGLLDRAAPPRRVVLHLENRGMGLVHGTATVEDADWLALGDGAGAARKVFQFRGELELPVQVVARRLRAGRPQQGQIVLETNGGTAAVLVRAEVPARPFPDGPLAGARTPRQLAEKARANPKAAAPYFESGAVAAWYAANGWTYPVQGPASSGLGAVQQFFEALGLARPPQVEISHRTLALYGPPGAALEESIQVRTVEKRPVFAHAAADQPWLKVGRAALDGRTARIPVRVPMVPVRPGEQLRGTVRVTANGNQHFAVDVVLTVQGTPLPPSVRTALSLPPPPPAPAPDSAAADPEDAPTRRFARRLGHLAPLVLVVLALAGTLVHDYRLPSSAARTPVAAGPEPPTPVNAEPALAVLFQEGDGAGHAAMRFGLVMLRERDPADRKRPKRLTYHERGETNNTCLLVDGRPFLFGDRHGQRLEPDRDLGDRPGAGRLCVWGTPRLRVSQRVEIVAAGQSGRADTCLVRYTIENRDERPYRIGLRFLLDTFIGANDGVPFTVPGLTGLCDTQADFRGERVPDFIQALEHDDLARPGTVAHLQFRLGPAVEPPTRVTLGAWPSVLFQQAGYPEARGGWTLWDVPLLDIGELPRRARAGDIEVRRGEADDADSAVTMYWEPRELPPGGTRTVGFAYGLGEVASSQSEGRLLLTVGGRLVRGGAFTLTALVDHPRPGERLTLQVPDGFELIEGAAEQPVPPVPHGAARAVSPVTWRLRPRREGQFRLEVRSTSGAAQAQPVTIRTRGVFD